MGDPEMWWNRCCAVLSLLEGEQHDPYATKIPVALTTKEIVAHRLFASSAVPGILRDLRRDGSITYEGGKWTPRALAKTARRRSLGKAGT